MQALQDRQREAGGLAGARLGAGEKIAAAQHGGNGLSLDRRGLRVAQLVDGPHERFGETERCKRHKYS
ncbi:hypothetical protein DO70_4211 [Burkholderia pseudomallei]|nr:hypothetical protein DO70_4211 [Burkholderia pseudomallei]